LKQIRPIQDGKITKKAGIIIPAFQIFYWFMLFLGHEEVVLLNPSLSGLRQVWKKKESALWTDSFLFILMKNV
jgi:hypothetical protein